MNHKTHEEYLKEFKSYSREIIASESSTKKFLEKIGVNTPTGRLTKAYSHTIQSKVDLKK